MLVYQSVNSPFHNSSLIYKNVLTFILECSLKIISDMCLHLIHKKMLTIKTLLKQVLRILFIIYRPAIWNKRSQQW